MRAIKILKPICVMRTISGQGIDRAVGMCFNLTRGQKCPLEATFGGFFVMQFIAELKKTQQLKRVSGDNEYQIVLITDNPEVLDLGKLKAETLFDVVIVGREER